MSAGLTLVDAVIFDMGGVLVEVDYLAAAETLARAVHLPAAEVRRRLLSSPELLAFELGRLSPRDFHARVEALMEHDHAYETFCEAWNAMLPRVIADTVALATGLLDRPGLSLGILSNTNAIHVEHLRGQLALLAQIEHVVLSHEIGHGKPAPEAYLHALAKMGVRAEQAVFVDDLPVNVEAARQLGMHAVLATDPAAVRAGLSALGIG